MLVPSPGNRIVLVTGASSGIGRECALRFARLGDTVVGVARHGRALRELGAGAPRRHGGARRELAAEQPGVHVEACDVTLASERAALVERVLAAHGRIDVLVNNAG